MRGWDPGGRVTAFDLFLTSLKNVRVCVCVCVLPLLRYRCTDSKLKGRMCLDDGGDENAL